MTQQTELDKAREEFDHALYGDSEQYRANPQHRSIDIRYTAIAYREAAEAEIARLNDSDYPILAACTKERNAAEEVIRELKATIKQQAEEIERLNAGSMVAGNYATGTYQNLVVRCEALMKEEQEKVSPNNTLISILCDTIRLTRENTDLARRKLI